MPRGTRASSAIAVRIGMEIGQALPWKWPPSHSLLLCPVLRPLTLLGTFCDHRLEAVPDGEGCLKSELAVASSRAQRL